ncbi:MAG: hypothetical protein K0Q43_150 [Ramlibacter sp.]|jgi:type II secretory pathway component PulF|nr:hypothetical protein [Ramlibacter sp.]
MFDELSRSIKLRPFQAERADFYDHLARAIRQKELLRSYLEEELRIARARNTADKSKAFALHEMLRRVMKADDVALSRVVGGSMPAADRMMLAAVDESKDKPQTLEDVATAIRDQQQARKVLVTAMLTPLILVPGILVFSYVLGAMVIPAISKVAPPHIWTPYLSLVRGVANAIAQYFLVAFVVAAVAVAAFVWALPRWTGLWRQRLERINSKTATLLFPVAPFLLPLALYRDFTAGQVLTTLAVLLNGGATLTGALKTIAKNGTPYTRWHMRRMLSHLDQFSTDYVAAFARGLLSPRLLALLASRIRNAPKFDAVLVDIGTKGGAVIREEVKRSAVSINAMLILGGAGLVIFLYSGQMLIADAVAEAMDPMKKTSRK